MKHPVECRDCQASGGDLLRGVSELLRIWQSARVMVGLVLKCTRIRVQQPGIQ